MELYQHQLEALGNIKNGSILCGGVGSGKSLTSLAYYYLEQGGTYRFFRHRKYDRMVNPKDLYIITTARKRDELDWEGEMVPFLISTNPKIHSYENKVVVDSWNNIGKYANVYGAFFIFDEQRLVGSGPWVKSFLKIAKKNRWILLSATPADSWKDYIPVFVANGFYRNKTEFLDMHVVYKRFVKYPVIDRYVYTKRLEECRDAILVDMHFQRHTKQIHEDIFVEYDKDLYKNTVRTRWNPYTNVPIKTASEFCYLSRKIVNSDPERVRILLELQKKHQKIIIFYNFDYELEILRDISWPKGVKIGEWNGHKHEPTPEGDEWVYFVQYTSGCEGWNCITTDTIVFYSQNYSHKVMVQASGRTDRLNTPYTDLYYYHLKSRAPIDVAITRALKQKKNFSERKFAKFNSKGVIL